MLTDFADQASQFIAGSKEYIGPWLMALGILWLINIINWILGSPLNYLGLYPRRISGLPGILFAPFLHGDFSHLFFNSIPLFVLGLALLTEGVNLFISVTIIIMLLEGISVWLVGRPARHIGASGIISGYFGYIIVNAYLAPSFTTAILAILVIYYFGSIFLGIFPQEEQVSWESHLLGFLSGIAAA
jgi:membrane associated rhomboid family serine protease